MAFSINFNAEATSALSILQGTTRDLAETQSRISSGLKVASSRDDASTYNIAQGLRSTIQTQNTINQSIALGQSTLSVATSATENISETINTIRDKVIQSQGENVDRQVIQNDIDELVGQIESQVQSASFNGTNLLNGGGGDFSVLIGLSGGSGENLNITKQDLTTTGGSGANEITANTFRGTSSTAGGDAVVSFENTTFDNGAGESAFKSVTITLADSAGNAAADTTLEIDLTSGSHDTAAELATELQSKIQGIGGAFANVTVAHSNGTFTFSDADGRDGTGGNGDDNQAIFKTIEFERSGGGLADLKNIDVTTSDASRTASLTAIDNAENAVNAVDSFLGSKQSRLDQQSQFISSLVDSLNSGLSSLVDANLTEESVKLSRLQTQQQLGFQTLSIAGQQTQGLLGLFR